MEPNSYTPSSKGKIADKLVKDWRKNKSNQYYPADNDAEYYPPTYNNNYQNPSPYGNPSDNNYPHDNDQNYQTGYPKYDPDADNGGFYPQPGTPIKKSKDFDYYNYPLYYD